MKVLLVDDENHAIELFKGVMGLFENNMEVVGEAMDLESAITLINIHQPDVVFLDIDMPRMSGLKIVDFFDENRYFEIVYVTAHSRYAIEAIRTRAFDYLLKPIDAEVLKTAYQRLLKKIPSNETQNNNLLILTQKGLTKINRDEIVYLEASSVYCNIFMLDNTFYTVSKPLGNILPQLGNRFIRTHRSFAVNLKHVVSIKNNPLSIEVSNGKLIGLSRSQKENIIDLIKKVS